VTRLSASAVITAAKEIAGFLLRIEASWLGRRLEFGAGPVLVLAPHCDDEVLGCAGLLMAATRARVAMHVVVAAAGGDDVRREESRSGIAALGIDPACVQFLDHRDATLSSCVDELAGELAALIVELNPSVVLTTSTWDPHPDHAALGGALNAAVSAVDSRPQVLEYAIWQWESPRLVLRWLRAGDLTTLAAMRAVHVVRLRRLDRARKRAALLHHQSQLEPSSDGRMAIDARVTRRFLGGAEVFKPGPAVPPAGPTMPGWVLPGDTR
jgi:LmbE family N-acetylglucosaminyl deacetylase